MLRRFVSATIVISVASIWIVGAATYQGKRIVEDTPQSELVVVDTSQTNNVTAPVYNPKLFVAFPDTAIQGMGGFVGSVDVKSGVITPLYTKNEKTHLPIASISKLVTAYVAVQNRSLDEVFTVSEWAISGPWPSYKFQVGDRYTLRELLEATLVESNNDAARVIASNNGEKQFVQKMNTAAAILALPDTQLYSSDGTERKVANVWQENTSTPEDIAHLIVNLYMRAPELLEVTTKESVLITDVTGTKSFTAYSTNRLLDYFKNGYTLLGGKTGTSDRERRHLVILFQDKYQNTYVAVVLRSPDSFSDMQRLLDAVDTYNQSLYAQS